MVDNRLVTLTDENPTYNLTKGRFIVNNQYLFLNYFTGFHEKASFPCTAQGISAFSPIEVAGVLNGSYKDMKT
jgi:hypothetical protein